MIQLVMMDVASFYLVETFSKESLFVSTALLLFRTGISLVLFFSVSSSYPSLLLLMPSLSMLFYLENSLSFLSIFIFFFIFFDLFSFSCMPQFPQVLQVIVRVELWNDFGQDFFLDAFMKDSISDAVAQLFVQNLFWIFLISDYLSAIFCLFSIFLGVNPFFFLLLSPFSLCYFIFLIYSLFIQKITKLI